MIFTPPSLPLQYFMRCDPWSLSDVSPCTSNTSVQILPINQPILGLIFILCIGLFILCVIATHYLISIVSPLLLWITLMELCLWLQGNISFQPPPPRHNTLPPNWVQKVFSLGVQHYFFQDQPLYVLVGHFLFCLNNILP